ncbi:histone deacetylase 15-like isoform X2 [Curcuma longa]|uniref:histone deacetylase 15-like isoform X2 n=1 Tax=Curcuma longa TaxID=136217 RepID=UPI003D9EA573
MSLDVTRSGVILTCRSSTQKDCFDNCNYTCKPNRAFGIWMASETLCTSLKGKKICGKNRVHNEIHSGECQNCSYESHDLPSETPVHRPISEVRSVTNTSEKACLNEEHDYCDAHCSGHLQQCMKHEKNSTLEELYLQEEYDEDDEDDSDWEPVSPFLIRKWFCTNCTMPNFDDVCHCEVCGEDRECELLRPSGPPVQQEIKLAINSGGSHNHQDLSSKSRTAIGFDERMLLHSEVDMKSHPHPERPDRLKAIASDLAAAGIFPGKCYSIPAREITKEELLQVHTLDHIEAVQYTCHMHASYFTSDTYANEHSARAARLAAGLCADLACTILSGGAKNGFALVRPPGHHAGVSQAMGFCLHNNAAVASLAAQRAGAKKILIVDWDVHHGNGTQEIFYHNKSVLYISLHRHENGRFYPGTGAVDEVGSMDGEGFSVNIPWNCGGVGDNDYVFAFQHVVIPIALQFAPDITIVSAGFDAARGDPLGCCDVTPAGYAQMTHMLSSLSQGKLLVILEGGYNLRSISSSATAVVKVLLGESPSGQIDNMPSKAGLQTVLQVMQIQMKYWPILKPNFMMLQSQWSTVISPIRDQIKRRRHPLGPVWWKWRSKKFIYERLYGQPYPRRHLSFRGLG